MKARNWRRTARGMVMCAAVALSAKAQRGAPQYSGDDHLRLLTFQVTIDPSVVNWGEVCFAVEPGYAVNAHTPTDQTIVPTTLQVPKWNGGLLAQDQMWPATTDVALRGTVQKTLQMYTGNLCVKTALMTQTSGQRFAGKLVYQVCSVTSCSKVRKFKFDVPVKLKSAPLNGNPFPQHN